MNEQLMDQLQEERLRGAKLFEKFLVLSSVQGRLNGVIKHHKCQQLVDFASDLLMMIEDELEDIDKRHRKPL